MVTAPGFADTADKFALTSQLLKITFPYILLISLASLVGAILNTWNRLDSGVCPTLLNISMIGFALFPHRSAPTRCWRWRGLLRSAASCSWLLSATAPEDRHAGPAAH
ncbi:lipid II flippase MurJ [Escherichia coli]